MQVLPIRTASLHGQRAQPQRKRATHADLRFGECVHDACVGECLAASRRGHIDDKGTALSSARTQTLSRIRSPILPAKAQRFTAFAQTAMTRQSRQMALETWKRARDASCITRNTEQVFVQSLLQGAI